MLIGSKAISERFDLPVYSIMRLYKTGVIPGISIGKGRGSKLLFDPDLVAEALRNRMIEDQQQRRVYCEGS